MTEYGKVRSQTLTGDKVVVGDVVVTPQSQALTMRWPQGGWVWNRAVAVLVTRGERERRIPIVDVTRVGQLALYGAAAVFTIVGLIQMIRRGEKQK